MNIIHTPRVLDSTMQRYKIITRKKKINRNLFGIALTFSSRSVALHSYQNRGSGNTEDYFIKDCSSSISINRDNSQDRGKNNMPYLDL